MGQSEAVLAARGSESLLGRACAFVDSLARFPRSMELDDAPLPPLLLAVPSAVAAEALASGETPQKDESSPTPSTANAPHEPGSKEGPNASSATAFGSALARRRVSMASARLLASTM